MVRGRRKPTATGLGGCWTAGHVGASISHRPGRHNARPGAGWAITTPRPSPAAPVIHAPTRRHCFEIGVHLPQRHSRAGGNPGEGGAALPPRGRRASDREPTVAGCRGGIPPSAIRPLPQQNICPTLPPAHQDQDTRRSPCSGAAKLSHDVLPLSEKVRGGGPSVPRRCYAGRGPWRGRRVRPPCPPQRRRWVAWCKPLPALRDADPCSSGPTPCQRAAAVPVSRDDAMQAAVQGEDAEITLRVLPKGGDGQRGANPSRRSVMRTLVAQA